MRSRTLLLLAIALTSVPVAVRGVLAPPGAGAEVGETPHRRGAAHAESPPRLAALQVLQSWDARRSDAWSRGDVDALSRLYTVGSATGAADVRALRRWTRRGLTVSELRQQVSAIRAVRQGDRRLVLVVTERTVGGHAVSRGERTAVPPSVWATHRVRLVRSARGWQVAVVRAEAGAGL